MKRILLFLLPVFLCGCMGSASVESAFRHEFANRYQGRDVVLFDARPYDLPTGEPRYHAIGAVEEPETERWRVLWADFAKRNRFQWIAVAYPEEPWPDAPTRNEARVIATDYLEAFLEGRTKMGRVARDPRAYEDLPYRESRYEDWKL